MATPASLRVLRQNLHLSYSQVSTYLSCSLRYFFHYVQGLPPEHLGSSLLLGTAVHAAIARYYETIQSTGHQDKPASVLEFFSDHLANSIAQAQIPILYKDEAPDADRLIVQGEGLLQAFLTQPAFDGLEVVAVELPLSARLTDGNGCVTDIELIGVIDLLLRDNLGRLLAIDHKTAKQPFTQDTIDHDLQLSTYALLLTENGFLEPGAALTCGFQVLRKLKNPKIERHLTLRTPDDIRRFAKVAKSVLQGIENQTFLPCSGWMCTDCPYASTCKAW